MNERQREILTEQATTAWRPRDPDGGLRPHPAFLDLDPAGRAALHRQIELQRALEAALDRSGLSTTGHAVLRRIADA